MADTNVTLRTWTLNANDDYYLKWPQDSLYAGKPYTLICHLVDSSDDGTYTVKARPIGSSATPVAIVYQSLHLNGVAGTGGLVSTGITGTSIIAIEADGLEIVLSRAGGTTGSSALTMAVASMA